MSDLSDLSDETLDAYWKSFDNENWRGWGVTFVVHSLIAALRDARNEVRGQVDLATRVAEVEAERDKNRKFGTEMIRQTERLQDERDEARQALANLREKVAALGRTLSALRADPANPKPETNAGLPDCDDWPAPCNHDPACALHPRTDAAEPVPSGALCPGPGCTEGYHRADCPVPRDLERDADAPSNPARELERLRERVAERLLEKAAEYDRPTQWVARDLFGIAARIARETVLVDDSDGGEHHG